MERVLYDLSPRQQSNPSRPGLHQNLFFSFSVPFFLPGRPSLLRVQCPPPSISFCTMILIPPFPLPIDDPYHGDNQEVFPNFTTSFFPIGVYICLLPQFVPLGSPFPRNRTRHPPFSQIPFLSLNPFLSFFRQDLAILFFFLLEKAGSPTVWAFPHSRVLCTF